MSVTPSYQILFVFSGPSGSGKETVMRSLLTRLPDLSRIVTYTTRSPRPGEKEGEQYHFVSESQFEGLRSSDQLFESEAVYGSHRYGSPKMAVEGTTGGDLVMELDPHGYQRIRDARLAPTVGIFLLVPTPAELEKRITARAKEQDLAARIETARGQLGPGEAYDYQVVNDDLHTCLDQVVTIVQAERLRRDGHRRLLEARRAFGA